MKAVQLRFVFPLYISSMPIEACWSLACGGPLELYSTCRAGGRRRAVYPEKKTSFDLPRGPTMDAHVRRRPALGQLRDKPEQRRSWSAARRSIPLAVRRSASVCSCTGLQASGVLALPPSAQVGPLARCTPKPRIMQRRRDADAETGKELMAREGMKK